MMLVNVYSFVFFGIVPFPSEFLNSILRSTNPFNDYLLGEQDALCKEHDYRHHNVAFLVEYYCIFFVHSVIL